MKSSRRVVVAGALAVLVGGTVTASAATVQKHVIMTWQTNGRVIAIAIVGNTAYLGGKFTSVRPAGNPAGTGEVSRNHAAAFNLTTNQLLPWNPNANGNVQAILPSGSTVYLGGSFTQLASKHHARLAAVDATTGAVSSTWKPSVNAQVMTLASAGSTLYAGGAFTTVNGTSRPYLAAIGTGNGSLETSFTANPDAAVQASTIAANGSRLVIGGTFTHVGGSSQNHIAALDPGTGATLSWATHVSYPVTNLASDTTGVFAAGGGSGGNFAAFAPTTGAMRWHGGTDGNVHAVALLDGNAYFGGHFQTYCGPVAGQHTCTTPTTRLKALAVDETTGTLQPWAPSVNSTLGIFAMASGTGTLAIGGDFTKISGTNQQGFAAFTN